MFAGSYFGKAYFVGTYFAPVTFLIFQPKEGDEGGSGRVVAVKGKPTNAEILAIQREDEDLIIIVTAIGEFVL